MQPAEPGPGMRVVVMGLGRFGGGLGVARWLASRGCRVTVTDRADAASLAAPVAALADLVDAGSVRLALGGHDRADFRAADLVVANPAVPRPWEDPFLGAAREVGVPITTEIRLVVERLDPDRVVGVTGTAGKSTTASMTAHLLRRLGRPVRLGGNIGGSLLAGIDAIGGDEIVVLELSSAMLHWLDADAGWPGAPGWSPRVAVLTNLAPNHLDWHGSFEHYERSKRVIFRHQRPGGARVDGSVFDRLRREIPLRLVGEHQQRNAATAMHAVFQAIGAAPPETAPLLADFEGLPHRLALVHESGGRRFYDDSKCTTPEGVALAIAAFPRPSRVHLIVGGADKGVALEGLGATTARLGGVYCIGATGERIAAIAARGGAGHVAECGTLDCAVAEAVDRMEPEDFLLLSPGCASWDQFDNYEQRGARFAELVLEATGIRSPRSSASAGTE